MPTPPAHSLAILACGALTLVLLAGCDNGPSPAIRQARERFLLAEEPPGATTALELSQQQPEFTEGPVVLRGQVGGMPNPWKGAEADFPWRKGEATFFLVDPATAATFAGHEHAADEDHADCVFCQKRAADSVQSLAAVSLNAPNGQPIKIDAQELLDLKPGDTVVVEGQGKRVGDLLVVEGTGVFVR